MELVIKDRVKAKKKPKNQFKFEIELMGGDADAYFYPQVLVNKDDTHLDRFLKFLENCKEKYPHGKGGFDGYDDVEDYWLFCGEEYPDEIEINGEWVEVTDEIQDRLDEETKACNIGFEWESNYEYMGVSSFRGYTVTYFDENGDEFKVEVKK